MIDGSYHIPSYLNTPTSISGAPLPHAPHAEYRRRRCDLPPTSTYSCSSFLATLTYHRTVTDSRRVRGGRASVSRTNTQAAYSYARAVPYGVACANAVLARHAWRRREGRVYNNDSQRHRLKLYLLPGCLRYHHYRRRTTAPLPPGMPGRAWMAATRLAENITRRLPGGLLSRLYS